MWSILRANPRAVFYAVLVHVALLIALVISLDWTVKPPSAGQKVEVVEAHVVDSARLEEEVRKLQQAERKQAQLKASEEKRLADLRTKRQAEEKRLKTLETQRKAKQKEEKKRLADLKKRQQTEEKHLARLQQEKEALTRQREVEAQRLAKLERERKQEQLRKKAEAQREKEEEKRKAEEAARMAKRQAEQQVREQALRNQLAAEQNARLIDKYVALIQEKVQRNWLRPPGEHKGISCEIRVRLIPGGEVVSARVVKSCGSSVFDRSVEAAVRKAAPLDLPPDPDLFEYFRELNFVFTPEE